MSAARGVREGLATEPCQPHQRFVRNSAFEIVLSPAIIDEIHKALRYPKVRKHVRAGIDAMAWFEAIVVLSDLIPGECALHGVSEDPNDDKYIAGAVEGRADFVVTGDPDLLEVEEHASVRIVSPRRFLGALV